MTLAAVRALLGRLWAVVAVRYGLLILALLGLLAAGWRAYIADRAATAEALSRAEIARQAARADADFYEAQADANADQRDIYKAALDKPATTMTCDGILTTTRLADGSTVQRCEGRATTTSVPVFPPPLLPIKPGQATAGMGAVGVVPPVARERFAVVAGLGARSVWDRPLRVGILAGAELRIFGSTWAGFLVGLPDSSAYLTVRQGFR